MNCKQCGGYFEPKRRDNLASDANYCSAKCKAAYHRDRTPDAEHAQKSSPDFHAAKDRDAHKNCEWCGGSFAYNEYAERGGQRVARFCSNRCRQASFRADKKAHAAAAAAAAAAQPAGEKYSQGKADAHAEEKRKAAERNRTYEDAKARDYENMRRRAEEMFRNQKAREAQPPPPSDGSFKYRQREPHIVLGVSPSADLKTARAAYRDLASQFHPDARAAGMSEQEATVRMQEINVAMDWFKRRWKTT